MVCRGGWRTRIENAERQRPQFPPSLDGGRLLRNMQEMPAAGVTGGVEMATLPREERRRRTGTWTLARNAGTGAGGIWRTGARQLIRRASLIN